MCRMIACCEATSHRWEGFRTPILRPVTANASGLRRAGSAEMSAPSPSAVLKNAIDWVYPEWNRKAAAFVSYGSAMGARGVQQLRETAIELQLAPIRSSVHIPVATLWAHYQGGDVDAGLAELEVPAGTLIDDLLWWTAALKAARATAS